ncbi:MAG: DUF512 domain-containing protein [Firmicutes bacterium]|nr:DUF512 domain-containing protein [Bacillota bacterium]
MRIKSVDKYSVGASLGLKPGDEIFAFDGYLFEDILDYEFYDAAEKFTMSIRKRQMGTGAFDKTFQVIKAPEETLGLSFDGDGIKLKACRNRCIFCFVDQLPPDKSLRRTLRIKDDDYRHSFLSGTYITLTNLSQSDFARIKRLKFSPLYVSVHTTDEALRRKMLGISKRCHGVGLTDSGIGGKNTERSLSAVSQPDPVTAPVLSLLKELHGAGIRLHAQIVYCPGVNEDIEKSARELFPFCESLAVVPVGLTRYQNPDLRAVSREDAQKIIDLTEKLQTEFLAERDTRFVWAADEFYLKAGVELPGSEPYEDYPQIENGVGLLAKFDEDFAYGLEEMKRNAKNVGRKQIANYKLKITDSDEAPNEKSSAIPHSSFLIPRSVSLATGVSAYPFIKQKAQILSEKFNVQIYVYAIENRFFGPSVTVAGLLTGSDLASGLKGKPLGEVLLLPSVMFRSGSEEFLDNMTLSGLSEILGVPIQKIPPNGESFVLSVAKIMGF